MSIETLLDKLEYRAILYGGEEGELVLTLPHNYSIKEDYHKHIWYWFNEEGLDICFDGVNEPHSISLPEYAIKTFVLRDILERLININYSANLVKNIMHDGSDVDSFNIFFPEVEDKEREAGLIEVFSKVLTGIDLETCERLARHYDVEDAFIDVMIEEILL